MTKYMSAPSAGIICSHPPSCPVFRAFTVNYVTAYAVIATSYFPKLVLMYGNLSPFELKLATPVNRALGNVHTTFVCTTFFVFELKIRTG